MTTGTDTKTFTDLLIEYEKELQDIRERGNALSMSGFRLPEGLATVAEQVIVDKWLEIESEAHAVERTADEGFRHPGFASDPEWPQRYIDLQAEKDAVVVQLQALDKMRSILHEYKRANGGHVQISLRSFSAGRAWENVNSENKDGDLYRRREALDTSMGHLSRRGSIVERVRDRVNAQWRADREKATEDAVRVFLERADPQGDFKAQYGAVVKAISFRANEKVLALRIESEAVIEKIIALGN